MQQIKNNPYRIIGLLAGASLKEQTRQTNRLKQFIEAEQEVTDDWSFPILGELNRTTSGLNDSVAKLNLNNDRINAALFWFYNGNHVDEASFESLKDNNLQNALHIWERKAANGEVTQSSHSAFHNLSTLKLWYAFENGNINQALLKDGISLKLKFIESDFISELKSLTTDETYRTNKTELQLFFLNAVYAEVERNGSNASQVFLEAIKNITFTSKDDFLKSFIQKPIELIEKQVTVSKERRKTKKDVIVAGANLYKEAKPNIDTLKSILGTSNLKFQAISDKVSDEVLQCGIQLFNDFKDHSTYDAGKPAMDLFIKAKSLAIGNIAKQRCQENTEGLQEWIDEKPEREKQNKIKIDFENLIAIFEEFESKSETINNAKLLIQRTKDNLNNIKSVLGHNDEFYLKVSTKVAAQAQSYIISEVNEAQDNFDYKMALDRHGTINKLKNTLKNAWDATLLIGTIDMEYDFKSNRYATNKESLKGLCIQLGVFAGASSSTPTSRPITSTNTNKTTEEGIPGWVKLVGGIILLFILAKACN